MLPTKPRCGAAASRRARFGGAIAAPIRHRHRLLCRAAAPFGVAAADAVQHVSLDSYAVQHVSFDSYVDIVDFHMSNVEHLLKATVEATDFIAQEIAIVFVCLIIMNVLTSRHW